MFKPFTKTVIAGVNYTVPDTLLTSDAIEAHLTPLYERLKLPLGRLEGMTGIRSRYFWTEKPQLSQKAAEAAKPFLQEGPIDAVIYAAVCRQHLEPATAAYVHQALGLSPDALFFDLSSACVGFLNAVYVGAHFIETGRMKRVLIVATENGRPLLDATLNTLLEPSQTRQSIKPYFPNLTIGAGACAMLLCHESLANKPNWRLKQAIYQSDTTAVNLCEGDGNAGGYNMQTQAESLLLAGLQLSKKAWALFLKTTGCSVHDFQTILTHQVGLQHHLQLYDALGIPIEKSFCTYPEWGNVGSVSLPLTFANYLEKHPNASGSLALLGIGSGLTTMMMHLETDV
jgi:3-oxoacyl-[acyl-carrier-protein] synthase-3